MTRKFLVGGFHPENHLFSHFTHFKTRAVTHGTIGASSTFMTNISCVARKRATHTHSHQQPANLTGLRLDQELQ